MTEAAKTTIDQAEVDRFSAMAAEWWDPSGKFKPLHKFNPVRIAYIRDKVSEKFGRDPKSHRPLEGLRVLDIGCGGGLLCEPMTRLGATVTGIDAARRNIATASLHAEGQGLAIDYRETTASPRPILSKAASSSITAPSRRRHWPPMTRSSMSCLIWKWSSMSPTCHSSSRPALPWSSPAG